MKSFEPKRVAFAAASGILASCFGTPTPLAPGFSGSVGFPHHGVQTDSIELPRQGPGYARYRPNDDHYWGQPYLVRAIQRAAATVAEQLPGGAPLLIGDLSARHGGKISRHNSHRSGRDVDLLWYVTTPRGATRRNPNFVRVGTDGLAPIPKHPGEYVRLDVPREWMLVKALLQSPDIDVQWMFCSRTVEALVIQHAIARNENPELIWHAQNVLLQPGDSLSHDDHIHLRAACPPESRVLGCEGGGPLWNWLPPSPALAELADEGLTELVGPYSLSD